jgi:hypothetical protein
MPQQKGNMVPILPQKHEIRTEIERNIHEYDKKKERNL